MGLEQIQIKQRQKVDPYKHNRHFMTTKAAGLRQDKHLLIYLFLYS